MATPIPVLELAKNEERKALPIYENSNLIPDLEKSLPRGTEEVAISKRGREIIVEVMR